MPAPPAVPAPSARPPSGLRQSALREANLALVLGTVLAADAPLSRAGVASETGVTRSTASRLVDELVGAGLLAEVGAGPTTGPGRPGTLLAPGAGFAAVGLQVDVGQLAVRVLDLRGATVAEVLQPGDHLASDPSVVLVRLGVLLAQVLAGLPSGLRLVGAGLALPGLLDPDGRRLLYAPNLGWSDVEPGPLLGVGADALAARGLTLTLGNEADLGATAVARPRPGRPGPWPDFLYLSGEIGVGGSVVRDGRVSTGRRGWGGEVGHVCVDPHGPPCRCGSTGCLERYAGRAALLAAAGLPPTATSADLLAATGASVDAALERAAWALGVALASVVNVLDVPVIVLGGHLGLVGARLQAPLSAHLARRVLGARWSPPALHLAPPTSAAGATGAALVALSTLVTAPTPWLTP